VDLEQRLRKLENESYNNTLRRQLDAHYSGQILNHLVSTGLVDGEQLKQAIQKIGESIKTEGNLNPDSAMTVDEHTAQWLKHIQDNERKEFVLSGGVS